MNMREFARRIAQQEGGKVNLSIAQISEVIRLTMLGLAEMDDCDIINQINRYRENDPYY